MVKTKNLSWPILTVVADPSTDTISVSPPVTLCYTLQIYVHDHKHAVLLILYGFI